MWSYREGNEKVDRLAKKKKKKHVDIKIKFSKSEGESSVEKGMKI